MSYKPKTSKILCGTCAAHPDLPAHQRILLATQNLRACKEWKLAPRSVEEYNYLIVFFPYREDLITRQLAAGTDPYRTALLTRQLTTVRAEIKMLNEIDTSLTHPK